MLQHVLEFHSFLCLNNVPLCVFTTYCLPVHLLLDIWAVYTFWLLWITILSFKLRLILIMVKWLLRIPSLFFPDNGRTPMKARVGIIAIGQSAFFIGVTGQEVFMNGLSQQQELGASSGRWGRTNNRGQNHVRPEPWAVVLGLCSSAPRRPSRSISPCTVKWMCPPRACPFSRYF